MSENTPEVPQDPINDEASDWEEAGLPAQEDSTEDEVLPTDRDGPAVMGDPADSPEEPTGDTLDEALAREEPDAPEAGGSTAPARPDSAFPAGERTEGVRLTEPDEGAREDTEESAVADDVGHDRGAYSAEEQAVREEDEFKLP